MRPLGLIIGRFQPFHRGHEIICRQALDECEQLLIVLGSGQQARSIRNPWTDSERERLIPQSLPDVAANRLLFENVPDVFYNEQVWLDLVKTAVDKHRAGGSVCLYGHTKDSSSYYLALFPQWDYVELPNYRGLSATPLREALLAAGPKGADKVLDRWRNELPDSGEEALRLLLDDQPFAQVCEEFAVIKSYREAWAAAPYPPVFVTVDALVECADHILLIQRGQIPGLGLWALPGGFLDQDERLEAGARRELLEETGLDLNSQNANPIASHVYDAPERSDRGRFVTHLFHYRLNADELPAVQGGDDAATARWWRFEDIRREHLFDDHYCVLQHALNRY